MPLEQNTELRPFGETTCEAEIKLLGEKEYSNYYFNQTRFNKPSLGRRTYLIIGRRGSGKTSLARHFSFQTHIRNAISISDLNEKELFEEIAKKLLSSNWTFREVTIPRLSKMWHLLIWHAIFIHLQDHDERIKAAVLLSGEDGTLSHFLLRALKSLIGRILGNKDESLVDELEKLLTDSRLQAAKEAVLELTKTTPIIISVDTLDNYTVTDKNMASIVASLIQCGYEFNQEYSLKNIHLKVFVMAEVFPFLKEQVIQNNLRYVQDEVYLHWHPKDLMRLISWRFHYYLKSRDLLPSKMLDIDWDNYRDVAQKFWQPFFGKNLKNGGGLAETSFPYVLRHGQMRPRQLILLCNGIARQSSLVSEYETDFRGFSETQIVNGIREEEDVLCDEVFNSYNEVYSNLREIVNALLGINVLFKGSELDKRAHTTAKRWNTAEEYSPYNFRKLVAELGIVGRVRKHDKSTGIVEADFEYFLKDRLPLNSEDECVIHPMFYKKLHINVEPKVIVYPFPDHPEFKDLDY